MDRSGSLQVRVFATTAQLPLEGATVVVTRENKNGKFDLVGVQITDRSGKIRPITVPTPPERESLAPGERGELPYTRCDVWAEHPGYAALRIEGVQIFPGVVTRQEMALLPLGEGSQDLGQVGVRRVTGQSL